MMEREKSNVKGETFRIIHIGDAHLDQKHIAKIEPSLKQILEYCENVKVNAAVIPGDIWHCKQSYSNSSAVPLLFDFLRKLSKLVDFIFITKGNHDEAGSISLLHQLEPNIFAYEYPVCLAVPVEDCFTPFDLLRDARAHSKDEFQFIVSLVPYPTKSMFLSDDSIDNNNAEFVEKFEQVFELIGDVTQPYTCPKILGFHGNVVGSRLSSGQTLQSQDIMVAPSTLEKANADYYALNHIHLRQEIKPNMIYAGGIANFNWGETEQKSFEVIELDDFPVVFPKQILLISARPMVKLEFVFKNGVILDEELGYEYHGYIFDDNDDPEFRLRIKVFENERKLFTDEKINELKDFFGQDVKIEFNVIPTERESRSERIMHCKTLVDEVKEYSTISGYFDGYREEFLPITKEIETKVIQLQEEVRL